VKLRLKTKHLQSEELYSELYEQMTSSEYSSRPIQREGGSFLHFFIQNANYYRAFYSIGPPTTDYYGGSGFDSLSFE